MSDVRGHDPECPFCAIPQSQPEKLLATGDFAYALTPLDPVVPGHVLIVPFIHVKDFTTMPILSAEVMEFAAEYATSQIPGSVNLITSKGREATQSVFHLHLHLVPRARDDGLALPWYSGKGGHRD